MTSSIPSNNQRIWSVDILRGFVIALMAIDHIRDFWAITPFQPEDVAQTTAGWFFTRWITHFCAPVFVFLAGTSAFLLGNKLKDKARLSQFLLSRGLWLIFIELIIINMSWTFTWPITMGFAFIQVIWVIAISMMALAGLIWISDKWIMVFGLIIVIGHNLLDGITAESWGTLSWLWKILHVGWSFIPISNEPNFGILVAYPIIPWIGVMALGYIFGNVMLWEKNKRQSFIFKAGIGITLFFIVLRFTNWYGDLGTWSVQDRGILYTFLDLLNTAKYPPSLLFLCMTLGPGLLLLIPFENWKGKGMEIMKVFGKVPFFFYVIHFSVINLTSQLYTYFKFGSFINLFTTTMTQQPLPESYVPHLWLVYVVWVVLMVFLYFLCKWYGNYKSTHSYWWLKYV